MHKLNKKSGSVYSLCYHYISVVKYRQKVFTNVNIISDLKTINEEIALKNNIKIIEQECGNDHIHILFETEPTTNIVKFINTLKGYSSRKIRKKHKDFLKDKLWGDSFWSSSYFLVSCGNVTIDILKNYVENQRSNQI